MSFILIYVKNFIPSMLSSQVLVIQRITSTPQIHHFYTIVTDYSQVIVNIFPLVVQVIVARIFIISITKRTRHHPIHPQFPNWQHHLSRHCRHI